MKAQIWLLAAVLLLPDVGASQSWLNKDYHQWSEYDCQKLVADSPWSQTYSISQVFIDTTATAPTDRAREQNPRIEYLVQFRSAWPVRRAMVRLAQLKAKYDKLTPEQRKQFDESTGRFLNVSVKDSVIVHVTFNANVQDDDRELSRYWQNQTTETLKNFVYLLASGGETIALTSYVPGRGAAREFQFVFPRQQKGRNIIGPQDKTIAVEFIHPNIRGQGEKRVYVPFRVEKMMIGGEVLY